MNLPDSVREKVKTLGDDLRVVAGDSRVQVVAIFLAIGGLLEYLLMNALTPLYAVILTIAFGVGAGLLFGLAYLVGDLIPAIVAEPIASALALVGLMQFDRPVLFQTPDGGYELRDRPDLGPESFWARFRLQRLGFAYAPDEGLWQDQLLAESRQDEIRAFADGGRRTNGQGDDADDPADKRVLRKHRANMASWIPLDIDPNRVMVRIPDVLVEWKDAANGRSAYHEYREALKRHAGDGAGANLGPLKMGIVTLLFTAMGFGMYVVVMT